MIVDTHLAILFTACFYPPDFPSYAPGQYPPSSAPNSDAALAGQHGPSAHLNLKTSNWRNNTTIAWHTRYVDSKAVTNILVFYPSIPVKVISVPRYVLLSMYSNQFMR